MPIILAIWEEKITRIRVSGQPEQKVLETSSQPIKNWVQRQMPVIPAIREA
jgi:hypothetical protein